MHYRDVSKEQPEETEMARYDTYRQVARQEKYSRQRREDAQAIEDAYQAVLAAKAAYDDAPSGGDRAEFAAFTAAVDALAGLDPKHHYFS